MFKIQQEGQVICFQLDVQVTQAVPGRWSFAATSGQIMAASCLVVQFFAIFMGYMILVGGLEHVLFFRILGISSSQLTHIFQKGWHHQPGYIYIYT